jgi:hypothetical protein
VPPSILNSFLSGDKDMELAPALSRVGLVLQYHQERPTSPLNISIKMNKPVLVLLLILGFVALSERFEVVFDQVRNKISRAILDAFG